MKRFIFIFLFISTFCYPEYTLIVGGTRFAEKYKAKDESRPVHKSTDEAADYIYDKITSEQKLRVKLSYNFRINLYRIDHYALFGHSENNDLYIKDCLKQGNIDRNSNILLSLTCSSFVKYKLWLKFNKDILLTDLENLNPEEYFKQLNIKINNNIKNNNLRSFLAFPVWIFEKKTDYFNEKDFNQSYYDYALNNYKNNSEIQHLLLLYVTYFSKDTQIVSFLENLMKTRSDTINFPVDIEDEKNSLFYHEEYKNCQKYSICERAIKLPVAVKKITIAEFAFNCLLSVLKEDKYESIDGYFNMKTKYSNNEYLNNKYNAVFDEKMIDELINTPEKLLKAIFLTNKVIYSYCYGYPIKKDDKFFDILYKKLESKLKTFKEPVHKFEVEFIKDRKEYSEENNENYDLKYLKSLKYLVRNISNEELIKIFSKEEFEFYKKTKENDKSINDYKNWLFEYGYLINFIYMYEQERLFKVLGKDKFFDAIELHYINKEYSFYDQEEYLDLLYKIDFKKFENNYIYNDFIFDKNDKGKEPISQVFFIEYLLKKDINKYKSFLKNWLISLGCKGEYYYKQSRIILIILKNGNKKYKDFYNEIINDKNFVKCSGE